MEVSDRNYCKVNAVNRAKFKMWVATMLCINSDVMDNCNVFLVVDTIVACRVRLVRGNKK